MCVFIIADPTSIVLPEVIEVVCNHINDDWKDLACFIGLTEEFINRIDKEAELTATKMKMCLKEIRNNVSWKFLKMQLQKLGRLDIVKMLMDRTLLTIGKCTDFSYLSIVIMEAIIRELF